MSWKIRPRKFGKLAVTKEVANVSVVVVNYNSGDYLLSCVTSIMDSTYPSMELIVVDNASTDDSVAKMRAAFPDVPVVRNKVNLGYAAAGNIGFTLADGNSEFMVLMNPDTQVDADWLERLVDAACRNPRGAFFQPKILFMDDQRILNSAGNMIHITGFGVCRGMGRVDGEEFQDESEVCYASGACTLVRRTALHEIGPSEDLFFAYGEDKDWGWRAGMMRWQSVYVPSSRILHKWSPTLGQTSGKFYLLEFERLLSISKNYSKRTIILLSPALLIVELWVLLYAAVRGWLREKLRSYVSLFGVRHLVKQRREVVQAHRTASDTALVRSFVTNMEHPYLGPAAKVLNRIVSCVVKIVIGSI